MPKDVEMAILIYVFVVLQPDFSAEAEWTGKNGYKISQTQKSRYDGKHCLLLEQT